MSVLTNVKSRPFVGLLILLPFTLLFTHTLWSGIAVNDRLGTVIGVLGLACCALLVANNIVFILDRHRLRPLTETVALGPNELLVRIPIVIEEESDWESGHHSTYPTIREFEIVAETLDLHTAAAVSFELDGGDLLPDGITGLTEQLRPLVEARREKYLADRTAAGSHGAQRLDIKTIAVAPTAEGAGL